MQAMLSFKGERGDMKGCKSVEWLQKKSWRGAAWGEVGSDYLYTSLRLLWYAIVSMEVFTFTKCAAQGLKVGKFSTSEFSSCRRCREHYFSIQWNNNSKVAAGSKRLSDLLEVTQKGPPASSLPPTRASSWGSNKPFASCLLIATDPKPFQHGCGYFSLFLFFSLWPE